MSHPGACVIGHPIIPSCGNRIFPTHHRQGAIDGRGSSRAIGSAQQGLVGCSVEVSRALHSAAVVGTVSGSNPDPEDRLIGQQQWQVIHERRAAGQAIAAIARELDLDRKTVRTCLQQSTWAPYRREASGSALLDAERAWLVQRASQVQHSARILYQELKQRGLGRQLRDRQAGGPSAAGRCTDRGH